MDLPREGREYAIFPMNQLPEGLIPEVRFGTDAQWHALQRHQGAYRLLIQGPQAPAGTGVVVDEDCEVFGRIANSPEIIIRKAGRIRLVKAVG